MIDFVNRLNITTHLAWENKIENEDFSIINKFLKSLTKFRDQGGNNMEIFSIEVFSIQIHFKILKITKTDNIYESSLQFNIFNLFSILVLNYILLLKIGTNFFLKIK